MDYFYTITSAGVDDTVKGTKKADTLIGLEGDTLVKGLAGDDDLTGVDPTNYGAGEGEVDLLVGGSGADIFNLGDEYEAFYQGDDSNADIRDFDSAEGDKLVVYGTADDYTLAEEEGGLTVEYLGDYVAYLEGVSTLDSSDFIFL